MLANAGSSSMAPTLEMDEAVWDEMIEINLTGAWKTVRAAVPHIVRGGRGGSMILNEPAYQLFRPDLESPHAPTSRKPHAR